MSAVVVPCSIFTERKRLLEESRRQGCDSLALATVDLVALKTLVRAIVFQHGDVLRESLIEEANRLAGTPVPWGRL